MKKFFWLVGGIFLVWLLLSSFEGRYLLGAIVFFTVALMFEWNDDKKKQEAKRIMWEVGYDEGYQAATRGKNDGNKDNQQNNKEIEPQAFDREPYELIKEIVKLDKAKTEDEEHVRQWHMKLHEKQLEKENFEIEVLERDWLENVADTKIEDTSAISGNKLFLLGQKYETGNGVNKNHNIAMYCYHAAALNGSIKACQRLGIVIANSAEAESQLAKLTDYWRAKSKIKARLPVAIPSNTNRWVYNKNSGVLTNRITGETYKGSQIKRVTGLPDGFEIQHGQTTWVNSYETDFE